MSDEQRQIDRPDKPFHKAECVCAACEDWRAANPLPDTPPAELGLELPEPGYHAMCLAVRLSNAVEQHGDFLLAKLGVRIQTKFDDGERVKLGRIIQSTINDAIKATVPLSSGERMCSCCGLCVKTTGGVLSDGVICQIDCLPKSALSSGEHRLMPPSSHAYGMRGSCECANCTQLRINELTAEVTRLKAELEAARRLIAAESAWEATNAND